MIHHKKIGDDLQKKENVKDLLLKKREQTFLHDEQKLRSS